MIRCFGFGMTKSMIIVVPPASPAAVPVKKSSLATVPMNGSCMCVCGSMPPGITYSPPASTTSKLPGAERSGPIAAILPSAHSTSARKVWSAVTTVPPLINTDIATSLGPAGHQEVDETAEERSREPAVSVEPLQRVRNQGDQRQRHG